MTYTSRPELTRCARIKKMQGALKKTTKRRKEKWSEIRCSEYVDERKDRERKRNEIGNDMQETPCLMLKGKVTASGFPYNVMFFFSCFLVLFSVTFLEIPLKVCWSSGVEAKP